MSLIDLHLMRCFKIFKSFLNVIKISHQKFSTHELKIFMLNFHKFHETFKNFQKFHWKAGYVFFHELLIKCRPLESAALGACPLSPPPPATTAANTSFRMLSSSRNVIQSSSQTCNRILNQYRHAINSYFHMIRIENFHVWCQVVTFSLRENSMKFHITTFTHSPSNMHGGQLPLYQNVN